VQPRAIRSNTNGQSNNLNRSNDNGSKNTADNTPIQRDGNVHNYRDIDNLYTVKMTPEEVQERQAIIAQQRKQPKAILIVDVDGCTVTCRLPNLAIAAKIMNVSKSILNDACTNRKLAPFGKYVAYEVTKRHVFIPELDVFKRSNATI
jgi:hypothetical protein